MAEAMLNLASVSYAESFAVEDDVTVRARERGLELGCTPIGPAGGATLRHQRPRLQAGDGAGNVE